MKLESGKVCIYTQNQHSDYVPESYFWGQIYEYGTWCWSRLCGGFECAYLISSMALNVNWLTLGSMWRTFTLQAPKLI